MAQILNSHGNSHPAVPVPPPPPRDPAVDPPPPPRVPEPMNEEWVFHMPYPVPPVRPRGPPRPGFLYPCALSHLFMMSQEDEAMYHFACHEVRRVIGRAGVGSR